MHQDAGRAVRCCGGLDGFGHAVRVRYVAMHGQAANVFGHALGVLHVEVEHRDLGAQTGEFTGGGFAQTGAAAGDQCCLSLDVHFFAFSVVLGAAPSPRFQ
jgi:hypothetical protein